MLAPKLKLKYELHYWDTDVTGSSERDWESLHLKPIYFPKQGQWGAWKYKLAIGGEWIVDFGNEDKGIGSGSDQIAPLVGVALVRGGTVIVPLVQHYVEYNGPEVNQTSIRLIAIQSLPNNFWGKLDAKIPVWMTAPPISSCHESICFFDKRFNRLISTCPYSKTKTGIHNN
jgi:hypothetical protein